MKWSWRTFGIEVAALLALSLLAAWNICLLFEYRADKVTPHDFTFVSCVLGSILVSLIFAALGSWRFWHAKPLFAAIATAATLTCFGAIGLGVIVTLLAAGFYVLNTKLRLAFTWYWPSSLNPDPCTKETNSGPTSES